MRDVQPSEVRPRPARIVVSAGFQMCSDLVALIPERWGGRLTWHAAPNVNAWVSKLKCGGSSRNGGRTARNLELLEANRGATPTARRIFGADERELLWIPRAYHGSDEVRAPSETRASAESSARRLVRGVFGPSPDSADCWPGEKAVSRGAPVNDASDPQGAVRRKPSRTLVGRGPCCQWPRCQTSAAPFARSRPAGVFSRNRSGPGAFEPRPPRIP